MGVWIETFKVDKSTKEYQVTPFVGVWIETVLNDVYLVALASHPSWVCGLKLSLPYFTSVRDNELCLKAL